MVHDDGSVVRQRFGLLFLLVAVVLFFSPQNWTTCFVPAKHQTKRLGLSSNDTSPVLQKDDTTAAIGRALSKYFVIHIGPAKTATTFIQIRSRFYQQKQFKEDNYHYIEQYLAPPNPVFNFISSRDCRMEVHFFARENGEPRPACWDTFVSGMKDFGNENMFTSSENMRMHKTADTPQWWQVVKEESAELGYKVVVVVTYRRLYEWLISEYTQFHNSRLKALGKKWREWPIQGGLRVEPFYPVVLSSQYVDRINGKFLWQAWTSSLLDVVPNNIELRVMNLYAPHTTEVKFFCDMLPEARHTCAYAKKLEDDLQNHNATETHANSASALCYDILVVAAADVGLVDTAIQDRWNLSLAAKKYHLFELNGTPSVLEWDCPTRQEMQPVLEASIRWEKEIMPEMDDEEGHREGFEMAFGKKKFCHLDKHATLVKKEWQQFFQRYVV